MAGLTDNEARALAYFAIGVSSEGGDVAYRLSFAGNIRNDAHGNPVMHPAGNSGYSIGTLQTDLGQRPAVATELTDAYQTWARTAHPDWVLTDAQRTQTIADLRRTGHQIEAQHGRPLDATVKSHLDTFVASDAGINFVHQRDTAQVDRLMEKVITPLQQTDLYRHASEQDQARLLTIGAKLFNQSEVYGNRLIDQVQAGQHHSVADVSRSLDGYASYVKDGRDHAVQGAELFNDLRASRVDHPLRPAFDHVVANPTVNPTRLDQDPTHPALPHEYAAIKDAFVDPAHARPMVHALEEGGSYAKAANRRGYYAEGNDLVVWNRSGQGQALVHGDWHVVDSAHITTHANADKTLDLTLHKDGTNVPLLHVTHPGNLRGAQAPAAHAASAHPAPPRGAADHAAAASHAATDHVQRTGTLREHDHSPRVAELQSRLAELGYKGADGRALHPDGDFGANTKFAVQAFQRDRHLADDGIAGTKTMDALKQPSHSTSPMLTDRTHPGSAMYQQSLAGVEAIDARYGRTSDETSHRFAGSVASAAHAAGLTRVDHVVMSEDAKTAYAVQGDLNSPFKQIAEVDVAKAVAQPLEQSGAGWQLPPSPHVAEPAVQQQQGSAVPR